MPKLRNESNQTSIKLFIIKDLRVIKEANECSLAIKSKVIIKESSAWLIQKKEHGIRVRKP
jgi:hypothetical protein